MSNLFYFLQFTLRVNTLHIQTNEKSIPSCLRYTLYEAFSIDCFIFKEEKTNISYVSL